MEPARINRAWNAVRRAGRRDGRRAARSRAGFTLLEILVVITIFVLLLAIAIPAFSSLIYGTTKSLAENQLKAGLAAGRDAAIQSERGDGAAVFFFQPGGRVSIVPCVQVGSFRDVTLRPRNVAERVSAAKQVDRDVFVPVPGFKPVDLPGGWSVRGFVAALRTNLRRDAVGAEAVSPASQNGWYPSLMNRRGVGNWVFPESNFLRLWNPDGTPIADQAVIGRQGAVRQSFMVRFKAGSGELDTSSRLPAIVVDPVDAPAYRDARVIPDLASGNTVAKRIARPDKGASTYEWVRRVLTVTDATTNPTGTPSGPTAEVFRQYVIGNESIDTVLAGSVSELALYNEQGFARAMAKSELYQTTGTVPTTGTYYADPIDWPSTLPADMMYSYPTYANGLFTLPPDGTARDAVQDGFASWVLGRLKLKTPPGGRTDVKYAASDAQVFVVQKLLGQVQEIKQ